MMIHSKKGALDIAVLIIVAFWLYQLWSLISKPQSLPDDFSTFVLQIAAYKSTQFLVIYVLLKVLGMGWDKVGLSTVDLKKQITNGVLYGLVMFVLFNIVLNSTMQALFPHSNSSSNGVMKYFTEIQNIYAWLLVGIFGGGVVEELLRIFYLTVFKERFNTTGLYIALICSSILFGWGHLYQGMGTAITVGLSGLTLGLIYIRRGSALEVMIIHALGDVLAILTAFLLKGSA